MVEGDGVTIPAPTLAVVTVGGSPIGASGGFSDMLVICPACEYAYQMDNDPRGFGLSPVGATVLVGYVERCPVCGALHGEGDVLRIGGMR